MNEEELLSRLHDGEIRNVRRSGNRVVVELDFVDRWEPQKEEGHYRLVYIPAHLIFKDAEIVTQTGDYACLDELPDFHHARTILEVWVEGGVYHFATTGDGSLAIRAGAVQLERLVENEPSDES